MWFSSAITMTSAGPVDGVADGGADDDRAGIDADADGDPERLDARDAESSRPSPPGPVEAHPATTAIRARAPQRNRITTASPGRSGQQRQQGLAEGGDGAGDVPVAHAG